LAVIPGSVEMTAAARWIDACGDLSSESSLR
jgi:hypothetical protein